MNILLIDDGSLDHGEIRGHLSAFLTEGRPLSIAHSARDVDRLIGQEQRFDVIIFGQPPQALVPEQLLEQISSSHPMAIMILVAQPAQHPGSSVRFDPARLKVLPPHQIPRLPYWLDQQSQRLKRHERALEAFPDLPFVHPDIFRIIASLTSSYVYIGRFTRDRDVEVIYRSAELVEMTGYSHEEIDAGGVEMLVHPDDLPVLYARRRALLSGDTRIDEFRIITRDGRVLWIRDHARAVPVNDDDKTHVVVGAAQDITNERLLQDRLSVQASVLELIASDASSDTVLTALCRIVEEQIPDAICSIQSVDPLANVLRPKISSKLPSEFVKLIQEIPIGPQHGACGNAAFRKQLVIASNARCDDRFALYQDLLEKFELSAVWSTPILSASGAVIGTFALYFRTVREPIDDELASLDSAAQIASISFDVESREIGRRLAEARYQSLVEHAPAITLMAHPDDPCYLTYLSPQFERFSEVPASEILENPDRVRNFVHPDDRPEFNRAIAHSIETGAPLQIDFRIERVSGAIAWVQASLSLIRDHEGTPLHWLGLMLDVTDRNEAIRQQMDTERRYRSLFDDTLNAIVIYNYEGNVIDVNPAAERLSGYSRDELLGGPLLWILIPEDRERAERCFLQARAGISQQFPLTMINKQGERVELSASHSPVVVNGEIVGVSSISEDITERRRLESQLLYHAYHDVLTGLPNRTYFDQMLSNEIDTLGRDAELAILFLDLNNFKVINDSLGHDIGDRYLAEISSTLRKVVPEDAVVARFGGDEFTILLAAAPDALQAATALSAEIIQALHRQIAVEGYELGTNVSIGIASTTLDDFCEPKELIRRADIALYDAKRGGKESTYRIFDQHMDHSVFERLWIERDLRQAVENGELEIHFQPLLDIRLGEVGVLEALVRWNHPERGLLLPERFLQIAEETGHILEIDAWVLRSACQQIADWNAAHPNHPPIYCGVNMSARAFWHGGLAQRVTSVLEETGLDPRLLCIEITESTLMRDTELATLGAQELREKGVLIAIDDFGTGYSSLSYLKTFPIDVLKIDQAFINGIEHDKQQVQLVEAIVTMAHALGLDVVAEGIESEEQYQRVSELGCNLAQGYFISRPLPFSEIPPVLNRYPTSLEA
jgi:diguanylate cyclase (GGDEF)-like protein/PAS domain S-box-containing protein